MSNVLWMSYRRLYNKPMCYLGRQYLNTVIAELIKLNNVANMQLYGLKYIQCLSAFCLINCQEILLRLSAPFWSFKTKHFFIASSIKSFSANIDESKLVVILSRCFFLST